MAYSYVTSRFGGTVSGSNTVLNSYVISAGQSVIIVVCDFASSGSSLNLTDGTNTYALRGSVNDTRNGLTFTLFDCMAPTPGTYTLTCTGFTTIGFWTNNYTGLQSYSASSFLSFFSGASPPTTTDGCTTGAITPSSYPGMIFGMGSVDGTYTAGTGFTARANASSSPTFYTEDKRLTSGSSIASFTMTAGGTDAIVIGAAYLEPTAAALDAGTLPKPGPGVSPSGRDQFHVSVRDTSAQSGSMFGRSYSVSADYGSLIAGAALFGQSDSVSAVYGQLQGTGAMPGVSCSVSIDFGVLAQSQANVGLIPRGGPGISPASMFQFSTLILDETLLFVLSNGIVTSASTAFGRVAGIGGMSGQSYAVSTIYQIAPNGPMQGESASATTVLGRLNAVGALTGTCDSVSISYGNLAGVAVSQMQGISTSASLSYARVDGITLSQMTGMSMGITTAYGASFPLFIERVVATSVGFYQNLRNIGDVFDVLVNDFASDTTDYIPGQIGSPFFGWMEIVPANTPLSANAPSPLVGPVFNGTTPQSTATTNKPRTVY